MSYSADVRRLRTRLLENINNIDSLGNRLRSEIEGLPLRDAQKRRELLSSLDNAIEYANKFKQQYENNVDGHIDRVIQWLEYYESLSFL